MVCVDLIVTVSVIDTVIVAALGTGNDTVIVTDTVDEGTHAVRARALCNRAVRRPVHGVDQAHGIGPVPERGHGHDFEPVHAPRAR